MCKGAAMAATTLDDVYDDPDNILAGDDDNVDGVPDEAQSHEPEDLEMADDLMEEEALRNHAEDRYRGAYHLGRTNPANERESTED